jgi:hypothetical protein
MKPAKILMRREHSLVMKCSLGPRYDWHKSFKEGGQRLKTWKDYTSTGKVMASIFLNFQGFFFFDFLIEQGTISATYYSKLLKDRAKRLSFKTTRPISRKRLSPPQHASAHRRYDSKNIGDIATSRLLS